MSVASSSKGLHRFAYRLPAETDALLMPSALHIGAHWRTGCTRSNRPRVRLRASVCLESLGE